MPNLHTGKDCCGCTACSAICPKDAIEMKPDGLGFLYPKVDPERCVECKLCEKVCAFRPDYQTPDNFEVPETWGARLKDIDEVMKSRSGGSFVAFSDKILEMGGVVYGAGYKDHFRVAHKRATTREERDEFRGSKYVQSDLQGVFRQVRDDLQAGLPVMFSGTPCQTSGLKSFIPKRLQEKLWVVDIVCHGTPSPYFFRDYLSYLEKKKGKTIIGVDFRDKKKFGWTAHRESFIFSDNSYLATDLYTYVFYEHIMLRDSCANCHFCNTRRPSDITLADYWGWERTGSDINADDRGLSLLLINTPKGKALFETVNDKLNLVPTTIEKSMQGHLKEATTPHPLRVQFERDYVEKGFKYVRYKYGNVSLKFKLVPLRKFAGRVKRRILRIFK